MIWAAKHVLFAALILVLSAYGLECVGVTTPEQSMQCCNTMRCHSPHNRHSHQSMDCCETVPHIQPALGQPSSVRAISFAPATLGLVQGFGDSRLMEVSRGIIGAHAHDPPLACALKMFPLRV